MVLILTLGLAMQPGLDTDAAPACASCSVASAPAPSPTPVALEATRQSRPAPEMSAGLLRLLDPAVKVGIVTQARYDTKP